MKLKENACLVLFEKDGAPHVRFADYMRYKDVYSTLQDAVANQAVGFRKLNPSQVVTVRRWWVEEASK